MTNQQKTILFWVGTALGAALVVFVAVSIKQKLQTAPSTNTVTFTGEGRVQATPDIALADFSIVTTSKTSKAAQDANSAKSKAVTDFLKKQGVEDKDISTTGYNIYPQYASPKVYFDRTAVLDLDNDQPKITGYTVNQNFQVKIRNLEKASAIVDGLVAAGVNQVNNLQFQVENPEAVKAEARQEAVADAKKKARDLENQIGLRLGRIVNFQENIGGYPIAMYSRAFEGGGGGYGGGPELPPGQNEITVSVTMTYQIK